MASEEHHMEQLEAELETGEKAALDLIAHVNRMGSAGVVIPLRVGDREWLIEVREAHMPPWTPMPMIEC